MVKVILHMSISLNGMIPRENDDTDFLTHANWDIFVELARKAGALIWGRKTHETVRNYGEQYIRDLDGLQRIVVSRAPVFNLEPGWVLAASPQEALIVVSNAGQQQALLVGGANLNTAFAREGLIDEVILQIESVIVGRGIPLFTPDDFDLRMQLVDVREINEKLVQLHYRVLKG